MEVSNPMAGVAEVMTELREQSENRATLKEALRSGDYRQSSGHLHDINGFCCLGVAADVCFNVAWERDDGPWYEDEDGFDDYLSEEKAHALGFDSRPDTRQTALLLAAGVSGSPEQRSIQDSLAKLNDNGHSFDTIADVIDRLFPGDPA